MPPKRKKIGKESGKKKQVKICNETSPRVKKEEQPSASEPEDLDEDPQDAENTPDAGKKGLDPDVSFIFEVPGKKDRIKCKECNKLFRFKNRYVVHMRDDHSKLPNSVACQKCPVRCPNAAALKRHIAEIHNRELFECEYCKKKFVRHAHVLRHLTQTGCDGTKVSVYPCEICNAQFSRKDNLMVHLRDQHIMQKEFRCKECRFSTSSLSKLVIHRQKFHTDTPIHYECDHCGKVVTSRPAIVKHLEIHGDKKFACDVCGYSTYTIEVIRRHVLTHVQDKPYKCQFCNDSFIQRSQLMRHLEKRHGPVCITCEIKFPTNKRLTEHMAEAHTEKIPEACYEKNDIINDQNEDIGDSPVKRRRQRKTILLIEGQEGQEWPCEVCGKKFLSEKLMRRHMSSHTLERPRRCMYCVAPRAYVRGEQLVRHVRRAHESVFKDHLHHIRKVLGTPGLEMQRVKKSEMESILTVLDTEAERILQGYGEGVLYGGMQEADPDAHIQIELSAETSKSASPLMSEEELANNLNNLLSQLIDKDLLECFGWPVEPVDTVLEKVIEHCGAKPADREKWTRVQRLRENAKHLFLYVIEDKNIARMLDSHTIDQIVKHILAQVSQDGKETEEERYVDIAENKQV